MNLRDILVGRAIVGVYRPREWVDIWHVLFRLDDGCQVILQDTFGHEHRALLDIKVADDYGGTITGIVYSAGRGRAKSGWVDTYEIRAGENVVFSFTETVEAPSRDLFGDYNACLIRRVPHEQYDAEKRRRQRLPLVAP